MKLDLQNLKKDFQKILEAQSCYLQSGNTTGEKASFTAEAATKPRKDMVLVSSDFNAGRIKSDPTGLVVSDRPSSQATAGTTPSRRSHARSVYRSHKRRLMARRESGDGAPIEVKPTGIASTPNNNRMVSPMRRIPIKEKLTELGSPFGLMPKQDSLKVMSLSPFQGIPDYKMVHRPSPEGIVATHARNNSCTAMTNSKKDIPKSEQLQNKDSKPMAKRYKKQFPKTPKSAKMAVHQLQTIGENEQFTVQNRKRNLFPENLMFENDCFTKNMKDITNISHISGKNLREQPSSTNFREQFQTTFDYPLHSTMNYPLHSTMQNAQKDLNLSDTESDVSSILLESPCYQKSQNELRHTKSSSGISLADSDNPTSPRPCDIPKKHYVNLSQAEGVNMDTFSFDEGILSNSESEECELKVNVPVTPVGVVKDYYTLTYTPEELKQEAADCDSDCNSSFLSFNVDNPTTEAEDHQHQGHFNMHNMVSCRCHVNQVYRIKRHIGFLEHSERNAHFVESTLSMDTRMRAIHPAELEMLNQKPHRSHSNVTDQHVSSKLSSGHSTKHSYKKTANRINADSLLTSQSDLDLKPEQVFVQRPVEQKIQSTIASNKDKVLVKPVPGAETNCLNLGKILRVKEDKRDFVENTIINHTLANPNVTMVAQGCLGFLKRKNKSSKKTSKTKVKSEGKRNMQFDYGDEDKENTRSRPSQSRVKSQGVSCNMENRSEVSYCGSMVSNIDHELKRKLSKRMKEFRETTFTDPHRMYYQTMGHI